MNYFNTTNQSGETLVGYKKKALTQEQEIYQFLSKYGLTFSASEIEDSLFKDRNIPITSIRRSLTNLNHDLKIKKVGQIKGKYGRPETTYRVIGCQLDLF
tara:strand:+ start:1153 stop:1452 length:300 start_codon:yes stop_codon:yes gene_type:complete